MGALYNNLSKVKAASAQLALVSDATIVKTLHSLANNLRSQSSAIVQANAKDLAAVPANYALRPRLELTAKKIESIAADIEHVAQLPQPTNITLEQRTLENGLGLSRITVPLGVVAIIYEARPNVTVDVFSLCLKSGNACVLKGGSDAYETNRVLVDCIKLALIENQINPDSVYLLGPGRELTDELLKARDYIDVVIPRGGAGLITYVRDNAKIPVIETGAGVCHTYVDASADIALAAKIVANAKTNRPTACNALDTLIVHKNILPHLPKLIAPLIRQGVQLFADEAAFAALPGYPESSLRPALAEHFGTEFLSLAMAIKTVNTLDEALAHIAHYSSKHSEAIIATDEESIKQFLTAVDAAVVYSNASTALSDGGVFGLGAEVGISTQKLHARGPMGLSALTTYKWVARGSGQTRE